MHCILVLFFTIVCAFIFRVNAQDLKAILEELPNHPLYLMGSFRIDQENGSILKSLGALDPKLSAKKKTYVEGGYSGDYAEATLEQPTTYYGVRPFASMRLGRGSFPVYYDELSTADNGEFGVGVFVPLLRGREIDDIRANIAIAHLKRQASDVNRELVLLELKRDASKVFLGYEINKSKIAIYKELIDKAEARVSQITAEIAAGDKPRIALIDNERLLIKRRYEQNKIFEKVKVAKTKVLFYAPNFVHIDEKKYADSIEMIESEQKKFDSVTLKIKDLAVLKAKAVEKRPEMKVLGVKLNEIEQLLHLEENNLLPNLDLEVVRYDDMGRYESKKGDSPEIQGMLSFKMPLYRRKARGEVMKLRNKANEIRSKRDAVERKIKLSIDAIDVVYRRSLERMKMARKQVFYSKQLEEAEKEKFISGESNLIFVNIREQATADAEVQLLEAIGDLISARIDMKAAVGW